MEYIKASALTAEMLARQPIGIPIILCSDAPRAIRKLNEAGYKEVSLNKSLSSTLLKVQPEDRSSKVIVELQNIIFNSGHSVILTDYEMLFDPRYKLDVLKVFCDLSKQMRLAVKWCGRASNRTLEYAEPQYPDYHIYEIAKYTVICVK